MTKSLLRGPYTDTGRMTVSGRPAFSAARLTALSPRTLLRL